MRQCTYTIQDKYGMHARPAGQLSRLASSFDSTVTLQCGARSCDVKQLMQLMAVGIMQGDTITIQAVGTDEETCIAAVETFLTENV